MNSDLRRFFPEVSIDFFLKRQPSYSWILFDGKLGRSILSWRSACWIIQVPCIVTLIHQFFFKLFDRDLKDFSPQLSVLIGFLMNPNNTWGKFVCVQFLSNWILGDVFLGQCFVHICPQSSSLFVRFFPGVSTFIGYSWSVALWFPEPGYVVRCRRRCTGSLV